MRKMLNRILAVVVVAALQNGQSTGNADPVANICSPLCQEETSLEAECAKSRGCYELDENEDAVRYLACWRPCWDVAGQCFSLCAEEFDNILQGCYNICTSTPDDISCISSCFDQCFLRLKKDLLSDAVNVTVANITQNTTIANTTTIPSPPQQQLMMTSPTPATLDPDAIKGIVHNVEYKYRIDKEDNKTLELNDQYMDRFLSYVFKFTGNDIPHLNKTLKSDRTRQTVLNYLLPGVEREASASATSLPDPSAQLATISLTNSDTQNSFMRHKSVKAKNAVWKKLISDAFKLSSVPKSKDNYNLPVPPFLQRETGLPADPSTTLETSVSGVVNNETNHDGFLGIPKDQTEVAHGDREIPKDQILPSDVVSGVVVVGRKKRSSKQVPPVKTP